MKPIKLMISTMKDVDGNTSQGYYGLTADARSRYMIADILFMGETPIASMNRALNWLRFPRAQRASRQRTI